MHVLSSPTRLNSREKRLPKFPDRPDRYKQAFSLGIFTSHFHSGAKQQAAQMGAVSKAQEVMVKTTVEALGAAMGALQVVGAMVA